MIPVEKALENLFALVEPLGSEHVSLAEADGRVLTMDAVARRDQPPFDASAMDGYAVQTTDARPGKRLRVVGEAAAGHSFAGSVATGEAARIFTGAPVPTGADRVVIQEDVTRDGDWITISETLGDGSNIRSRGSDFSDGETIAAPRVLAPADIALLAAMNVPEITVARKPSVVLISTGDELVMPGETPGPDQIIASNTFGLKALLTRAGAAPRILPIARDNRASLTMAFDLARGADLIVTIGGASVGDHDLVGDVAAELGMERAFYKVAMRPGKPLMAGRMQGAAMIGLPGNPVSAMVCGHVFVVPMIRAMLGLGNTPAPRSTACLTCDLPQNGPREHYMRAVVSNGQITPENRQDSALLSVLAGANALMIRPVDEAAREKEDVVEYLPV